MADQKDKFKPGEEVIMRGYQTTREGVVSEKTIGGTTKVKFPNGDNWLVSNTILERKKD